MDEITDEITDKINDERLIELALAARGNAYAPYSGFAVGAAVAFDSGHVYQGCNVEAASYGATNCAERTAVFAGVAAGEVKNGGRIAKVAVVGGKCDSSLDFCPPCGICLQVISEFACGEQCEILLARARLIAGKHEVVETKKYQLADLLPLGFGLPK